MLDDLCSVQIARFITFSCNRLHDATAPDSSLYLLSHKSGAANWAFMKSYFHSLFYNLDFWFDDKKLKKSKYHYGKICHVFFCKVKVFSFSSFYFLFVVFLIPSML